VADLVFAITWLPPGFRNGLALGPDDALPPGAGAVQGRSWYRRWWVPEPDRRHCLEGTPHVLVDVLLPPSPPHRPPALCSIASP
jgi:hypothetical protein